MSLRNQHKQDRMPWTAGIRATVVRAIVLCATCATVTSVRAQDPTPSPVPGHEREVQPQAPATTPPVPAQAPEAAVKTAPVWDARYHSLDDVTQMVAGWIASGAATKVDLPATRGGLGVPALQIGADGPVPLADRPTIFLLGGLDGMSLTGCEAVLAITSDLVAKRATLPNDTTFVVIPWASPDALGDTFAGQPAGGRDHLALDDDGDLAVDEDPPDDVDKDGLVLDMIVEDPSGPLARASDPRFLSAARAGDKPRYRLWREGRDDDHDGRFNEDPVGGVVLDLAFPVGWSLANADPSRTAGASVLPLDDPLTRALADMMLARTTMCVLLFQGNHGEIARPGGIESTSAESAHDQAAFDAVARIFANATGRVQKSARSVREARGVDRPGCALDWIHAVPGALAFEIAAWGPDVEHGAEPKDVGVTSARFESKDETTAGAPPVTPMDRAWARWLDNTRGGIGFVDWHPVDLGDGTKALVGGWEPFSRRNAPATSLPAATAGMSAFVMRLAQSAPRLAIDVIESKRDGDVITLRWRVENTGGLLTGISTLARGRPEHAPRCQLVLPAGARLLWGETGGPITDLAAGSASRELTSVVLAPEGSVLTLRASSGWTVPVSREVKP
jgi:hypothetical protein